MASRDQLLAYSQNPNVRQFLDAIAQAEGTTGYDTAFGGGTIPSLDDHPRQLYDFTQTDGQRNKTSAAGRYQFLQKTWDDVASQLGLSDFGPQSQDIAAVELLRRNGALEPLLQGDFDTAVQRSGSTWASLPSSPYAQPKRSPGFIASALDKAAEMAFPAAQAGTTPNPFDQFDEKPASNPFDQFDPPVANAGANPFDQFDTVEYTDGKGDSVRVPNEPAGGDDGASEEAPFGDRVLRQVGLTARAAATGLSALPEMALNPLAKMVGLPEMRVSNTLDYLGLPTPQTGTERVSQDVAGALAGVGGIGGIGTLLEGAAAPIARGIGSLLTPRAGTQAASAALGSGAASSAKDVGASPGVQLALGLGGSFAPSAIPYATNSLFKYLVRGGEQSRQVMQDRIRQFSQATGQMPTVGQASGRTILQGMENQLGKTLGSSGVMTRKIESQIDAMQKKVNDIADDLSPSSGAVEAGESIAKGIEGFKQGFRDLQGRLYGSLDKFLPGNTPITVNRTRAALEDMTSGIEGAPALDRFFQNAKIQGIERALQADLTGVPSISGAAGVSPAALRKPPTLPYEAIKKLRTLVGEELADAGFVADLPRSKFKALYAALSDDLGDAAAAAGPQAQGAWEWANSFTRQQMQRLDDLATVMNKDGPEKIFQAAMSGASEGNTVVKRVVDALPKQNRRDLASAVIRRMGRATPGNQDEMGGVFSPETFLTNWNKFSPEAKRTLFGRLGVDGVEDIIQQVARAANVMRESSRSLANPSGSGADVRLATQVMGGGLAAAMGEPMTAAGLLVGLPTAAYGTAKYLTSPSRVNRLSERVMMSPAATPSALNQLFQLTQTSER